MHSWSLIWWRIHSLSLTVQSCILEGYYLLKTFSQCLRPVLGMLRGSMWECGRVWKQDTLYVISNPLLLPPDLLLAWPEIGMPEFPATSPLHR